MKTSTSRLFNVTSDNDFSGRIYVNRRFLDETTAERMCTEMRVAARESAEILGDDLSRGRRASYVDVPPGTVARLERRLEAECLAIAGFYGVTLTAREGPGFLCYEPGGFYGPHRDRADAGSWPDAGRRQIAVVVFLNTVARGGGPGDFSGGALRLFVDGPSPVEVSPARGMLVAFPAHVLHEVTLVTSGVRFTVVDWFY